MAEGKKLKILTAVWGKTLSQHRATTLQVYMVEGFKGHFSVTAFAHVNWRTFDGISERTSFSNWPLSESSIKAVTLSPPPGVVVQSYKKYGSRLMTSRTCVTVRLYVKGDSVSKWPSLHLYSLFPTFQLLLSPQFLFTFATPKA